MTTEKPTMADDKSMEAEAPSMDAEKPAMSDASSDMTESDAMEAKGGYTIKSGDNLWNIARDELGDGRKWEAIRDANPDINPGNLKIGTTITLPAR